MADSGIYEIVNLVNGKRYIGSAVDLKSRWRRHVGSLRRGDHHCPPLQSAWQKHGEGQFELRILERCSKAHLIEREQSYLDRLKPEYNVAKVAGFRTFQGLKHTPETVERMRAAHLGKPGTTAGTKRAREAVEKTAEAHRGMKRSDETRRKISEKAKGRKFVRFNEDYRRKLSEASKGRMPSPEHMAALQAGRRRRVYTNEQRAEISRKLREQYADGTRSRERSPEYRAKISATLKSRAAKS